jgi:hypothetical protein
MLFHTLGGLALLTMLVILHRDGIANILPGWKTYVWSGLQASAGAVLAIVTYLQGFNFQSLGLSVEHAALMGLLLGVVGILLSYVTKRAP